MTNQSNFLSPLSSVVLALFCSLWIHATEIKPNVIIFYTDDQGMLDVNCFGSPDLLTPNMNRLARNGVRFTQAYAHTVCCPSRAALLTGRHPQRSNVNSWVQSRMHGPKGRNLALAEITLAETLQTAGYTTGLFGKWHLGAHPEHGPTCQGFDEFFGHRGGFIDNYRHFHLHSIGGHDLFEGTTEVFHRGQYFPDLMCDRALSFIERNQEAPFFLYFAMNLPHYPEQAEGPYANAYAEIPEPRRSYARVVSTCDHYLGRLLTQLDKLKLTDNTIILFTSDNGHSEEDYQIKADNHLSGYLKGHDYGPHGGGGNTGKWIGAKGSFLEGGIRTPAILSYPGNLPKNTVRNQPVTIMDWYPTILDLCKIPYPDKVQFDGRSTLPLIKDNKAPSQHKMLHWQWKNGWAVREEKWKLISKGSYGLAQPKLNALHLANLEDKNPERKNHAKAQPDLVKRLIAVHTAWAADVFKTYSE
ncbi:MAG: sulfatase-like hydrolase/transferase [Kiritimatiellae bacterium]|jgi:arylsulfatase A|nr:sulfatase-like hydrolase/transferase [Kiritimatiellia bacterium]